MEPILEARGLERGFSAGEGDRPVLHGVSLSVAPGEFVTVMGPSGSGKTTLLHCLSGLDRPDGGTVLLAGRDLFALTERARTLLRRQTLGFVFQFFNLLPDLTVAENLALPLLISGQDPARHAGRMRRLLEAMGLAALEDRLPHGLSGGEMQRVSIARALVAEPALLRADEPTGNLSSKAGEEVMDLFRSVRERFGAAILLVTHNPRDAARGDRVLFLKDGLLDPAAALEGPGLDAARVFSRLEALGI